MTGSIRDMAAVYIADNACSPEDASAFWARLPEKVAIALVKAAPKVAGPWRFDCHRWTREDCTCAGVEVAVVRPHTSESHIIWRTETERQNADNSDTGKELADASLRANGWILEPATGAQTAGLSVVVTELGGSK